MKKNRDLQSKDGSAPRVWISGKLNVVGTNDQENEKGSSCANGRPGIRSALRRRERRKEVLEDIEPNQSVVNRERDLDKEEIQQARRRERPQSCVQAPNQDRIHDQQNFTHYKVVVDLEKERKKRVRGRFFLLGKYFSLFFEHAQKNTRQNIKSCFFYP